MLCQTAKELSTRPSAMLGIENDYVAYCIDEAGAFLMRQKEPPRYGRNAGQLRAGDQASLESLCKLGAARMK